MRARGCCPPPFRLALPALLVIGAALAAACNATVPTPEASAPTGSAPTGASVAPSATTGPTASEAPGPTLPPGSLPLPTEFAIELHPGTYFSSPPFEIPFTFEVAEPGWVAGHLNPEFIDIQQYEGAPGVGVVPERIIGFGHPLQIHGAAIVEAADLTPAEAVDLWVERTDIETANVAELELLGGDAVRVDVHAPVPMLPLFGGPGGTFRLDEAFDVRIVVIAIDDGLFLATVHAPATDLEAAWEQALPALESIDLLP
jgi:hypothetical protein